MAQEPIYYNSTPTVMWTPAATLPNGDAFLPGDTVEYRVLVWDTELLGFAPPPAIGLMDLRVAWIDADPFAADVNGEESLVIDFADRRSWGVAIAATHIDGGGNRTDYSDYIASSRAADTASGVPFVYIPVPLPGAVQPGSDLRDSGM
jgi:hypothetical protein